ncbi:hypothetical protein [Kribbella sp. VKM Ac-2571]|uniref:hypothetical protein n=1 Tax=Kribbella sp. VKM Ac-2571 TaxID=2512222 RepID=UPI001EDE70E4|nr:hypothetical protein [Kribbella sp. VKM Ac-2571]
MGIPTRGERTVEWARAAAESSGCDAPPDAASARPAVRRERPLGRTHRAPAVGGLASEMWG